jgi:potassium-transporting ATPase KdpC subunit
MWNEIKSGVVMLIVITVITGIAYPLLVTGAAQALFPHQANGTLIMKNGKPIGSDLIGQPFSSAKYFWSRPSAISPKPYDSSTSGGSNLGPTNQALLDAVAERIKALREADPGNAAPVPVDLVTASASGLDPHISPAAAHYQAERVARARHLDPGRVRELIAKHTEKRQFWILGEPRVNVLKLNLELDTLGKG